MPNKSLRISNVSSLFGAAGGVSTDRRNYYPAVQLLDNQNNEITPLVDVHSIYASGDGTSAPGKGEIDLFYLLDSSLMDPTQVTKNSHILMGAEAKDDNTIHFKHSTVENVFSALYNTGVTAAAGCNSNNANPDDGTEWVVKTTTFDLHNPATYIPITITPNNQYIWVRVPKNTSKITVMGFSNGDFPQVIDGSTYVTSGSDYTYWLSADRFGYNSIPYNVIIYTE